MAIPTFEQWLAQAGLTTKGDENLKYYMGDQKVSPEELQTFYNQLYTPVNGKLPFGTAGLQYGDQGQFFDNSRRDAVSLNGQQYARTGEDVAGQGVMDYLKPILDKSGAQSTYNDQYGWLTPQSAFTDLQQESAKHLAGGEFDWLPYAFAALATAGVASSGGALAAGEGLGAGAGAGANPLFGEIYGAYNGGAVPSWISELSNASWGVNPQGLEGFANNYTNPFTAPDSPFLSATDVAGIGPQSIPGVDSAFGALTGANQYLPFGTSFIDTATGNLGSGLYNFGTGALNPGGAGSTSFGTPVGYNGQTTLGRLADGARSLFSGNGSGGSTLGNLLGGNGTGNDWMRLLGILGSTGLGIAGANAQTDAMKEMQDKYLALGAPYRSRLQSSYEPGFDMAKQDPAFQGALDQASNSVLKGLSTKGNPFDNPGGLMEANKYVTQNVALPQLNTYRSQLGSFGQLGVNTAGTAGLSAAQGAGGVYDALGAGLAGLTQPQNDLSALLKQLNGGKLSLGWGA